MAKFRPELSNFELKINCRCRSFGERLYQNFVIYVHAHKYKQAPSRVNHLKTKENTSNNDNGKKTKIILSYMIKANIKIKNHSRL